MQHKQGGIIWVYQVVDVAFPGDFQGFCGGPDLLCGQPEVRQVLLFSLVISAQKVRQVRILKGAGVIVRQLQLEFQVVFKLAYASMCFHNLPHVEFSESYIRFYGFHIV